MRWKDEGAGTRIKSNSPASFLHPLWPWAIREFLFFFPHAAAKR